MGGGVTGYIIKEKANKKAREAVRSSTVKIRGNDVIASVKVRACSTHACRSVDFLYYLTSSRLTSRSDVCDTQVLTALWMVPLTYTIYATLAGLYTGSFLVAVAVWLVLPFFSYIRYPAPLLPFCVALRMALTRVARWGHQHSSDAARSVHVEGALGRSYARPLRGQAACPAEGEAAPRPRAAQGRRGTRPPVRPPPPPLLPHLVCGQDEEEEVLILLLGCGAGWVPRSGSTA